MNEIKHVTARESWLYEHVHGNHLLIVGDLPIHLFQTLVKEEREITILDGMELQARLDYFQSKHVPSYHFLSMDDWKSASYKHYFDSVIIFERSNYTLKFLGWKSLLRSRGSCTFLINADDTRELYPAHPFWTDYFELEDHKHRLEELEWISPYIYIQFITTTHDHPLLMDVALLKKLEWIHKAREERILDYYKTQFKTEKLKKVEVMNQLRDHLSSEKNVLKKISGFAKRL
ncbi:hypothetical protein JCM21714_1462 [Gracilibacillus boraciitolerans JCM 21714]|uniref:Uncharacterized protein n=1 Tax=Gracilibacillus boraciitolerans JCM 21714 TaxID=1298598 RepID=W4VI90_9BACI|nr:hypothetical protein [Gracilibacillus boraciitolerans]GAE92459.1 hypothetical protein JCM21714_1462 [Gracilibacillus boraciitolerans JCM 21714]